jgi:high-affinity nickel-transport protein
MPFPEIIASSGLGSLLGVRHALEPDHLAAVTTLVSRERNGLRAALLGAWWGIGHTFALIVVGAALVVVRAELPASVTALFELGVALMLIALGIRSIDQARPQTPGGPLHLHRHGAVVHTHAGGPPHVHIGSWTFARRPLLVGTIHGLAGSGALTALVLATLPTNSERLAYVLLFGLGSTVSMAALSGLLGWPLARLGTNHRIARAISVVVGLVSIALGVVWGVKAVY